MALKKNRVEPYDGTTMRYFVNEVAEAGTFMSVKTTASGEYYGDSANVATAAANPSGQVPIGILMNDFVSIDETKYHRNFYKNQMPSGYKGTIAKRGEYCTNKIIGTPSGSQTAYLAASGNVSPTQATGAPAVGVFLTSVDASGYAVVQVNLG